MVSSIVPTFARQSKVASARSGSAIQPSRSHDSSTKESQQSGRMVNLRRSYQGAGITEEATSLLLASWRSSTTKHYNSSWRVWEWWCIQSGTNPISPSLSDILNFIASQFGEGKEYRSLNYYRSALSSDLSPIDGFDVGRRVDTSIFSAHSTRGASTSAATLAGITTQQILTTADWSSATVFKPPHWCALFWTP